MIPLAPRRGGGGGVVLGVPFSAARPAPGAARPGRRAGDARARAGRRGPHPGAERGALMPRSRVQLALVALLVLIVVAWLITR
ncbi:hypothetical protein [Nocardia abscessus]|uniref:hypothetical protein n=1 Tax=Nocardia abscessus TaxID=120957 RepID=UPI002455E18C|nr:hypothetical protein [Nocardia abscessus]